MLDQYDHQTIEKPEGNQPIYRITYDECCAMVNAMEDTFQPDVFGVEKEKGKVEGIIAAVYQSVFGGDVYPSLEEKAANLLYFMIKDPPMRMAVSESKRLYFWNFWIEIIFCIKMEKKE